MYLRPGLRSGMQRVHGLRHAAGAYLLRRHAAQPLADQLRVHDGPHLGARKAGRRASGPGATVYSGSRGR